MQDAEERSRRLEEEVKRTERAIQTLAAIERRKRDDDLAVKHLVSLIKKGGRAS